MTTVLVVDDEQAFADTLAERLRTRGLVVATAYDGSSAVEYVRQLRPAVVLLDLSMPGMDGLATLEAIKGLFPTTAVILLTAESGLTTAVAGMKRGAADYLVKPVPLDRILQAIQDAETQRLDAAKRQRMAETARLAALGELAVGVAHEINNPLQIVLNEVGWLAELLGEAPLSATTRAELDQSLATIREQTTRCKSITAQLLALRDAVPANDNLCPLNAVVEEVLQGRRQRWHERFGVAVDIPDTIVVPSSTWSRILHPLVDNAIDALEARIAYEQDQESSPLPQRMRITAQFPNDAELSLQVEDTGIGMESGVLARIFEPFFSTKEVGRGMGLGLSLCHALVEALGGRIEVHSIPGRGTTVTVIVPYHVPNTPAMPATAKEDSHEQNAVAHRR